MLLRNKKVFAVLAAACLVFGMVGCQTDTEQTFSETQQITAAAQTEQTLENTEVSEAENTLKNCLNSLDAFLKKLKLSNAVTYGVIDYNNDGTDEFFAVFSKGNQDYNEMKFYSIADGDNVNELFSSSGFCRDGETYFMYDEELSRLLIFSDYEHSYFLKNEKTEAVGNDGKVSILFDSTWQADSPEEELKQTTTYINSVEVPNDEYNNEYAIFKGNEYRDIMYIYDGKLFCGSELISGTENVYQDYLLKKQNVNN